MPDRIRIRVRPFHFVIGVAITSVAPLVPIALVHAVADWSALFLGLFAGLVVLVIGLALIVRTSMAFAKDNAQGPTKQSGIGTVAFVMQLAAAIVIAGVLLGVAGTPAGA